VANRPQLLVLRDAVVSPCAAATPSPAASAAGPS
jgi:hypothetical protein